MTKEAISTERALRLALEALEYIRNFETEVTSQTKYGNAAQVIEEALASEAIEQSAPATELREQEPVNQRAHEVALRQWEHWKQYTLELQKKLVKYEGGAPMVLNTAPQPAQQQEPVAYRSRIRNRDGQVTTAWVVHLEKSKNPSPRYEIESLYTTPPARKPLTHEQRVDLLAKFEAHKNEWHAPAILIDMVEAAHGIKEKNT